MKRVVYIPGSDWAAERLELEDEYGNRGEVRFPRERIRHYGSILGANEWEDAEVVMRSRLEGSADETAAAAQFALHLAHVAKRLDLVCADEAAAVKAMQSRQEAEADMRREMRALAKQMRSEEVAQYYMQMVRVQREGHRANAKGELNCTILHHGDEPTEIRSNMYLRESNGNRWRFEAHRIDKFEVKDGRSYNEVRLTPMDDLERQAREELENAKVKEQV